jgi:predicted transcriptional regulator
MPISYSQSPGRLVIEHDVDEVPLLLTQSELSRRAGRSPAYIAAKIAEGVVSPCARTESGISLFTLEALPLVSRPTVVRRGTVIEVTGLSS